MPVRISSMVLRLCVLIALVIGILHWVKVLDGATIMVHMLFGILVTLSLWALGYFILTAPKGASLGLGIGAFVLGICIIAVGLLQTQFSLGASQWIIQVLHLLLGLFGAGLGETIAGRYRRANPASAEA